MKGVSKEVVSPSFLIPAALPTHYLVLPQGRARGVAQSEGNTPEMKQLAQYDGEACYSCRRDLNKGILLLFFLLISFYLFYK